MYSIKLKLVNQEIKEILNKHGITGVIILHEPNYSQYDCHVEAPYSCAKISHLGMKFIHDPERMSETYNMVTHFKDLTQMLAFHFSNTHAALKQKWNGEDGEPTDTTRQEQEN